jgi:NitT/TauT family transport system substrate-binding protein
VHSTAFGRRVRKGGFQDMRSVGLTAALLLQLSACTRVPDRPLKVGTSPWAGSEPLYLARQMEQYPAQAIHLVEFTTPQQLARAFRNGVVDAATVPLPEALRFEDMGQQPRVVLMLDASLGADCLVARQEVGSLAQLKGRRVAFTGGAAEQQLLRRLAEDAREVVLPTEAQESAFKRNKVDAVLASGEVCERLLMAQSGAHRLFDSAQPPGELVDVLVVRQEALDAHADQVDTLLRGWFTALAHCEAHPEIAARRMAPRLGVDEEDFQRLLRDIHLADANEQRLHLMGYNPRLSATIHRLGEAMLRNQVLNEPPDSTRLLNAEPLARVLP